MTKLLSVDLVSSVPRPQALPEMTDLLNELYLNSGESFADRWEPVHVDIKDDRESLPGLTDFLLTVPFYIVSKQFAALLRDFHCECEFLPLVVRYGGKRLPEEYFALNVLRVVRNAVDIEKSRIGEYLQEFGLAHDVEKLVLKDQALDDAPLAYIKEIGEPAVNEDVAKAVISAGLVGINLLNPEKFRS